MLATYKMYKVHGKMVLNWENRKIRGSIQTHVLVIICPRAGHGIVRSAEGCCDSSLTIRSMSSRVLSVSGHN
uniref:Uncharacterized protein n=1 Tax=Trichogramma kaykai TaxID=54128 RepID=A0ABD2WB30_9HYME